MIFIRDLNCEIGDDVIGDFLDSYDLASLVRSPTCFQFDSPRCFDLILTNVKLSFQAATTIKQNCLCHGGNSDDLVSILAMAGTVAVNFCVYFDGLCIKKRLDKVKIVIFHFLG